MSELLSYSALMPPMCLLLVIPAGALLALRWRRTGLAIVLLASLVLYALGTSFTSQRLLAAVERQVPAPTSEALAHAEAIVVFGGDVYHGRPGVAAPDVGLLTLERLRMAAALYREHPLPILVTGASDDPEIPSCAALMARALTEDYGIAPHWIEEKARNTFENGANAAALLRTEHIARAIVVTQAWHMPRAIWSLTEAGIEAIPAPAERTFFGPRKDWIEFFPDYKSYARSFYALHEMLGLAYYRYRYGRSASKS